MFSSLFLIDNSPGTKRGAPGYYPHGRIARSIALCVLALFAALAASCPAPALQSQEVVIPLNQVSKRVLDNGMTVLVKEDHAAPVATVNVWVKTGYFNETREWTGISHLLEHLFFKGTPTRPVGKIQDEVKSYGGYWNAGTIYDHTNYYIVLPSSEINRALDIEADALLNSNFPQEEIDKEQEVVIQEILRKYDQPSAMAWEKMMDLLYTKHYLGRWRMGTPEQVRAMDRDVVVDYYSHRYRPENIVLVIAGDVNPQSVLAEAERLFGAMPAGDIRQHNSPDEPPQHTLRYRQDSMDITQTYLALGFQAPPVLDPDEHAAEALSYVLGSGKTSRLYRELKERAGLVHGISAGYYALPGAGTLYIEAELDAEKLPAVRDAVFREIERVKQSPPTAEELERIKARIEYGFLASMEDVSGQSNTLAYYESLGGYHLMNEYVARLRAVSPEDVQRVAGKYLEIEKAAIQEVRPQGKTDATTVEQVEASLRAAVAETQAAAPADAPPRGAAASGTLTDPAPDAPASRHTLSNGVTVIVKERHRLPLVSVGVYFDGGRLWETPDTAGLTSLTLSASLKGTASRSAEEIQNQIEALGTSLATSASPDYSAYGFSALSRNLAPALDILSDVILNPAFPAAEIEKERETQISQIIKNQDSMYAYPFQLARRVAYGSYPYGLPVSGYEATVKALTREQILSCFRNLVRANGSLMIVVGDVDTAAVLQMLEARFAGLPIAETQPAAPAAPGFSVGESVEERRKSQSAQAFAFPAVPAGSPAAPALSILRNVASGMGGRLYDEVREKRNLAYTVAAFLELNRNGGTLINYAATSPENEAEARRLMIEEWKKMAAGEISETEFENSRRYALGIYQIQLQANSDLRAQYAQNYFLGRDLDYIEAYSDQIRAVTLDDVKRVAADLAAPAGAALGVIRAVTE